MAEIYEKVPDERVGIKLKMTYRNWLGFPDKFSFIGAVLSSGGGPHYAYHTTGIQLIEIEIIPDKYFERDFPQSSASKVIK